MIYRALKFIDATGRFLMNELLEMTREVYHSYMDLNDNLYDKPIGLIGKRNLEKEKNDFLKRYINLIMHTRIVSETTKIYIRSYGSVASTIKHYNSSIPNGAKEKNIKTAQSNVNYDEVKLHRYFPDNMLSRIAYYGTVDIACYNKQLNLAIMDYAKRNKVLDNLSIRLPRVTLQDTLDEQEFLEFLEMLSPYFKKNIKAVEEELSNEAVGYFLYLLTSGELKPEDKARYKVIKEMLE
jgi:anaerobic ribonucleoside-triphosphate reductase